MELEITDEQIQKLGELSRIGVSEAEAKDIERKLKDVLGYVSTIREIAWENSDDVAPRTGAHRNIMRDDTEPHAPGLWSKALLNEAPFREGNFVKVKKVL